ARRARPDRGRRLRRGGAARSAREPAGRRPAQGPDDRFRAASRAAGDRRLTWRSVGPADLLGHDLCPGLAYEVSDLIRGQRRDLDPAPAHAAAAGRREDIRPCLEQQLLVMAIELHHDPALTNMDEAPATDLEGGLAEQ